MDGMEPYIEENWLIHGRGGLPLVKQAARQCNGNSTSTIGSIVDGMLSQLSRFHGRVWDKGSSYLQVITVSRHDISII